MYSVIFLVTTGIILPYIDRIPRRLLLLTGSIVCCICHFTIAGLMASYGHHVPEINGNTILRWQVNNDTAAKGIIAVSYIFVGFYGFTWAPCGWIYSSEVFPLKYRATGVGLSAATNCMIVSKPPAQDHVANPLFRDLQFCACVLRRPGLYQHSVENLHHLRRFLLCHDHPHLLHVP